MNSIQSFKLSHQGRIASAISMAMILPFISMGAVAANITPTADTNTSVTQVGQVDVVNIANPNSNGLSHNQYKDFNVSEAGAVLNNSMAAGQSQLAGALDANSHLSGAASVILNEVVSKNPSLLLGQQEVFGMAADYVLANPNGITGKNIGFINTNRASLVVGKPTIADERLAGFDVGNRNSKTLALSGNVDGNKRLDLLAPRVDINGNISATDTINVISGRNQIDYDTLKVSALEGYQPHVTLDGQILGSMQSGRIRLHNTDSDATQTLQGTFTADTDFEASADHLRVVDSSIVNSPNISDRTAETGSVILTGNDSLYVGGDVTTQRVDGETTTEMLDDRVKLTNSSYQETQDFVGSDVTGNNITLAGGNIAIEGSQLTGNSITASGDTIDINGVKTTNTVSSTARNSKGLWFNENESLSQVQQQQQSSLTANGNVAIKADSDLTVAGTTINGNGVTLTAVNDLIATTETTENSTSAINRYARETANLKAGSHTITDAEQTGYQTAITGSNVSLTSGGTQRLEGIKLNAATATLKSTGDLSVANSSTSNRHTDEEDFKYWGGIGGGETLVNNETQTTLMGSQMTTDSVSLSSDADISVTASQITANDNADITATGDLTVEHSFATNQDYVESRHGAAFNITDKKQVSDHQANTTVSAQISGDNVALTGENIAVTGSKVTAAKDLNVNAQSTLTTDIANATDVTKTESYDLTSESDVTIEADFSGGIAHLADGLNSIQIDASGSLKGVDTITTKGTGSAIGNTLTANNVNLTGQEVALKGSTINSVTDATITGNQVTIGAGEALTAVDSKAYKSTGPDAYIRGGLSGIEVGVSIGTDQVISEYEAYAAVNSTIDAGSRADLSATDALTNQGTRISAAQVNLAANNIANEASYNRAVKRNVVAGGEASLEGFLGGTPLVGGAISLSGEGVGETTEVKTANTTDITAADTVNIAATDTAVDAGTAINANNITISADDYTGTAAYHSDITTTHSGSGNIDVSAGTNDLINVDVAVSGTGDYLYQQDGSADAVSGRFNAQTVVIQGGKRAVAAQDVTAGAYSITASEEARIAQNEDKQWNIVGGAELGGSVGLSINTAAAATGAVVPLPSFAGNAGFNYLSVEDSQAKAATVNVQDLSVTADELAQVDGADITSNTVTVSANQANILAAQDKHHAVGVAMGGNAAFSLNLLEGGGASTNDLGLGAKLGVINETSNAAHGATIETGDLTVTANDNDHALVVEGANITADNVSLTNTGDVLVIAAESKDYVGNVGIGGNLSANANDSDIDNSDSDDSNLDVSNMGAYLNVETDNSSYYTLGSVNANTITIDSGNDVTLQTNVDAGTLDTVAGNDFEIASAQDDSTKVKVTTELAVDGSPIAFIDRVTAGDVIGALTDDFNNGTVLGVSATGQAGFNVDDNKVTQQAVVTADNFNATVGSQNIEVTATNVRAAQSNINGASVNTSDTDDFVHTVGIEADAETISVPNFVQTIPTLIKDAVDGKPVELPVNVDVNYEWDDTDGSNTKANVAL